MMAIPVNFKRLSINSQQDLSPPFRDNIMPGWSRQRSESKLAAWAKSQDIATVERELERTEKDIRRAGSLSLNPEYVMKRQQERARARDATGRLSTIGLRLDLGPFLFDQPPPPPPTPVSTSKLPIKSNDEQREILHLRNELSKLKTREGELEKALLISERKRDEERKAHERERKIMVSSIRKLKAEVEDGWIRMIRLREKYEGPVFPTESGRNAARQIYQTDESYETVYRPSSSRRVSMEASPDRHSPCNLSRRPSSTQLNSRPVQPAPSHAHLNDSIRKPATLAPRPRTASILKNPLVDSSTRARRTSFS